MKKPLFKIIFLGAACSFLSASVWAQELSTDTVSNQNSRGWSTKKLSATGRTSDAAVPASKLNGAAVNDSSGHRVGQLQDIIVNPNTGRIDFAVLLLQAKGTAANAASQKVVPVPWSILKTSSASSQYAQTSEQPAFTVKLDQSKLNGGPTLDMSELSQSEWRQRVYSYYGVTPPSSMGSAESPEGESKGEGTREMQPSGPESRQPQN
jgi:sporulation protein YlmC with PRC-barrel domain